MIEAPSEPRDQRSSEGLDPDVPVKAIEVAPVVGPAGQIGEGPPDNKASGSSEAAGKDQATAPDADEKLGNDFRRSSIDQINISQTGTDNRTITNIAKMLVGIETEERIRLVEESRPFQEIAGSDLLEDFDAALASFNESNILLLGDAVSNKGAAIAFKLASLIDKTNKQENIRAFSLASLVSRQASIYSFSFERPGGASESVDPDEDIVIIIDAFKNADKFIDSLLNSDLILYQQLTRDLLINKIFLICLMPTKSLERRINDRSMGPIRFASWNAAGAAPGQNSPEIDSKIEGLVDSSQVESADDEDEHLIIETVLFIAAFFPDRLVSDFVFLVDLWLENEDKARSLENSPGTADKEGAKVPSLQRKWAMRADAYLRKCSLRQEKGAGNKRYIAFVDAYAADSAKQVLEESIPLSLHRKIELLTHLGLIFHKSENIAAPSIALLGEYFANNPKINIEWLHRIFTFLNGVEEITETLDVLDILGAIPQQYIRDKEKEVKEKQFFYSRLARLFRSMLRDTELVPIVKEVFDMLIQDRSYKSVLLIVKGLQFAPNFNQFYWLKQLAERGDRGMRANIQEYLVTGLLERKIEPETLTEWLPAEDLPIENSSQTNEMALIVLVTYLISATQQFDEEAYHGNPTELSLFELDNYQIAFERIDLYMRNMLHPWKIKIWQNIWENIKIRNNDLNEIFPDTFPYIYLVAQLIELWGFILYTPPGHRSKDEDVASQDQLGSRLSSPEILDLLLERLAERTTREEQKELRSFWNAMKETLGHQIKNDRYLKLKAQDELLVHKVFLGKLEEAFVRKTFKKP